MERGWAEVSIVAAGASDVTILDDLFTDGMVRIGPGESLSLVRADDDPGEADEERRTADAADPGAETGPTGTAEASEEPRRADPGEEPSGFDELAPDSPPRPRRVWVHDQLASTVGVTVDLTTDLRERIIGAAAELSTLRAGEALRVQVRRSDLPALGDARALIERAIDARAQLVIEVRDSDE